MYTDKNLKNKNLFIKNINYEVKKNGKLNQII